MMNNKEHRLALLSAFGFASIFGLSFMFSRNALNTIDPLHLLALRFLVAVSVMNLLRGIGWIKIELTQSLKPLLLLGLFQPILYFLSETIGINLTSASEAGLMVSTIPIFTLILARLFLKEQPGTYQVMAIVLSVLGVSLIGAMQLTGPVGSNPLGMFILLGAPIAAGGFSVMSRKLSTQYTAVSMTYVMMHIGLVAFLPASVLQHIIQGQLATFFIPLTVTSVLSGILYLGIMSSVVAFFLMNYALARLSASHVSAFPSLTTLIAVVAGVVFLSEQIYWYHILGGTCILLGVWGANHLGAISAERQNLASEPTLQTGK